jgi:hypothetical protein
VRLLIAGSTPVVRHSSGISISPAGLAASPPTFARPSPSRAAAWTRPRDRSSASNSWISSRSRRIPNPTANQPFDRAAARAPIDHGNRLLYGVQRFFPFQQSFSRLLRHTAFGCKGSGWRTEGTVKLEAIPTTVGTVNPKVCSGSRKSPLSFGLEFRFRSTATQTFFEPATSPLGGKRDYGTRLEKDRNASRSCRSIASTK